MSNSNCLNGMKCPNCGSLGPFRIWAIVSGWAEVHDDGIEHHAGDTEWDDNSECECCKCDEMNNVAGFKKGFEK